METIINYLSKARLARKQVHRNLTLFPLLAPTGVKPDYSVLEEALEKGLVEVTERDRDRDMRGVSNNSYGKKKKCGCALKRRA